MPPKVNTKKSRFHYEFGGPYLGPLGMIIGLPLLIFLYAKYCGNEGWPTAGMTLSDLTPLNLINGAF